MTDTSQLTELLHLCHLERKSPHGDLNHPTHRNLAFAFDSYESINDAFQGRSSAFTYARQANPTVRDLENKINLLEDARATLCFSTGMAAIGSLLFSLLQAGDHLVASQYLFGNTRSLFTSFRKFGIRVDFVDTCDVNHVRSVITSDTTAVFVETIANPLTQIPDLEKIGDLCKEHGLLYIVDNTLTSPALFKPRAVGASFVINSLSKYIGGSGTALGGSISDTGLFDFSDFSGIDPVYRDRVESSQFAKMQIAKKGLRDFGATLSADAANLLSTGLETLYLRLGKISANALAIAKKLQAHPLVDKVYYPGLEEHPQHDKAKAWFGGFSGVLSFDLSPACDMSTFFREIALVSISTHLADIRTLIIPVASTIFFEMGEAARQSMGISDNTLRLSVGIEDPADILNDLINAAEHSTKQR